MEPHDELQARVVERLRAADGAPVSFDELRGMGIENPALLGYELAAAGLPIEQAREPGGRALTLGSPAQDSDGREQPAENTPRTAVSAPALAALGSRLRPLLRLHPLSSLHPNRAGVAASVALTGVLVAVLALALSDHSARTDRLSADHARAARAGSHGAIHHAAHATSAPAPVVRRPAAPKLAQPTPQLAVSPAAAASLEATGHELLTDGRYAQAIGELRDAIGASGGSLARCAEPASEACLTYAYALYDLGSALRLDGDPGAAIPILSERLRINNQRATVEEQLDLARAGDA
jgi:hypothetical protein